MIAEAIMLIGYHVDWFRIIKYMNANKAIEFAEQLKKGIDVLTDSCHISPLFDMSRYSLNSSNVIIEL